MKNQFKKALRNTFVYDIVRFVRQRNATRINSRYKRSYSQCGEDIIIDLLLQTLDIKTPTYLDIGCHDPIIMNNTYLFYQKGFKGVCVEPDPSLFHRLIKIRKRDHCLNAGIGTTQKDRAEFYIMTSSTLNTFSKEVAEAYQSEGKQKIEKIIQIPMIPINDIIGNFFTDRPNIISLDTEGLDLEILRALDFSRFRPEIFCIETLTFSETRTERKLPEIIDFMIANNYLLYADTFINSIFVDKQSWLNR